MNSFALNFTRIFQYEITCFDNNPSSAIFRCHRHVIFGLEPTGIKLSVVCRDPVLPNVLLRVNKIAFCACGAAQVGVIIFNEVNKTK
jgi:hypothetical protein